MSPLPQRKKTAEELTQLREQLGIPHHPAPAPIPQPAAPPQAALPVAAETLSPSPPRHKPIRSLRKSEREPAPRHNRKRNSSAFSKIPTRRHSAEEIQELRRREALSQFSPNGIPALFPLPAPRWVVIPGYLFALSGAACHYWKEIPLAATTGAAGLALIVSLYILLRRPLSHHHAGFIGITTLLVLVFASLHYFPQLRHAS